MGFIHNDSWIKMKSLNILFLSLLILGHFELFAQKNSGIPMHSDIIQKLTPLMYEDQENNLHTAIKPYNHFEVGELQDSLIQSVYFEKEIEKKFPRWLFNAMFNKDLVKTYDKKENKYSLIINPLMDIRMGTSSDMDVLPFVNTRGFQIKGHIGKAMTYYTDVYENQARFPFYVEEWINRNGVVPGQGFPRDFNSILGDNSALDFSSSTGFVAFQANKNFNFQFGHGKHFIGEGHRSFFLSDNAFNYPYFRIKTSFWKINYVNLFAQMTDLQGLTSEDSKKKFYSAHYLSYNVTDNFNIGLFEAVVYQDSTQAFDINYLNPVILYRPIEFAVGSRKGNVLMGISASYKLKQKMMFYGQIMLDEFNFGEILKGDGWWANKFAFQLGFKSYDTFIKGLKIQTEFNYARPYTYTHGETGRNYGHYRQPLAHNLGANFIESVNIASYQKGRWSAQVEVMYLIQGRDTLDSNYGANIFISNHSDFRTPGDYGNETTQGIRSTTFYTDVKIGYVINPSYNLKIELGARLRNFTPEIETVDLKSLNTTYIHFGIITALNNKYYDF